MSEEIELLRDIRALLLAQRARQLSNHAGNARSDEDLRTIEVHGEQMQVLKQDVAAQLALEELERFKGLIE